MSCCLSRSFQPLCAARCGMEYHFVSVPPRPPPCPRSLFALSGPCYGTTSSSIKCSPWHAWGRIPWAHRWNPISLDPWTVVRARRSQGMPQHGAVSGAASTIDTRRLLPVVGRVKKGGVEHSRLSFHPFCIPHRGGQYRRHQLCFSIGATARGCLYAATARNPQRRR